MVRFIRRARQSQFFVFACNLFHRSSTLPRSNSGRKLISSTLRSTSFIGLYATSLLTGITATLRPSEVRMLRPKMPLPKSSPWVITV
jgi:hypothetical protein